MKRWIKNCAQLLALTLIMYIVTATFLFTVVKLATQAPVMFYTGLVVVVISCIVCSIVITYKEIRNDDK